MSQTMRIATVTLNPSIDQTLSIPHFEAGKVNRVQHTQSDPGGKGVNVASFLADFGFPIAVTGFLGQENIQIFERLFTQKQIEDRFVRIAGSTRPCLKIIDETNQETTDINFSGQAPTADDLQTLLQTVEDLAADCPWFVLSGSVPKGAPSDIYGELIKIIKAKERAVALDTSKEGLRLALPSAPTLVKPNIDELQELVGRPLETPAEIIEAARSLNKQGIQTVVISMGEEGAIYVERQEVVWARPPLVKVKSTVGAGDAMVSGTVAGKIRGDSLADCARLATAFSLVAITTVGAGLPSLEAIETYADQVTVQAIIGKS